MSVEPATYGLRVAGLAPTAWLAVESPPPSWPVVAVRFDPGFTDRVPAVDLAARTVTVPAGAPPDVVVHPLLGHAGLGFAVGAGHDAIHAGAVVGDRGAWLVVGLKEAGKSTLMAALARAGVPVLADDVCVLADGHVLAGPRCVDLRHPPAGATDAVRFGARWRITLPPAVASAPLAGLVFPEWGEAAGTPRMAAADVLAALGALRSRDRFPQRPHTLLALAAIPSHRFVRPRDLGGLDASVARLRELLGA